MAGPELDSKHHSSTGDSVRPTDKYVSIKEVKFGTERSIFEEEESGVNTDDQWYESTAQQVAQVAIIQDIIVNPVMTDLPFGCGHGIKWDNDGNFCCGINAFEAVCGPCFNDEDQEENEENENQGDDDAVREEDEDDQWCIKEARMARGSNVDERPSQHDVDIHNLTHLPFRNWCPHCVKGKAK